MSARRPDSDRNVIPRWRDPRATARQGELGSVRPATERPSPDVFAEQEAAWSEFGTVSFAADLVGSALVVGSTPAAEEAARFLLTHENEVSSLAAGLARRLLDIGGDEALEPPPESNEETRAQIHDLRRRLHNDPRNTLVWTELARYYTIRNHRDQADRAMRIALSLSPEHRYVLRSAARLAVHQGEFEQAHDVIAKSAATPFDPWLVATELATAGPAGRRPKQMRTAERMLASSNFSSGSTSELASAMATLELRAGADKAARRLFNRSLVTPNENSVAQGEWASGLVRGVTVPQEQLELSAEARANRFGRAGEWQSALRAAWQWHFDQPFASGPAEFGSYQASLGQDFKQGAEFARAGLRANPGEFLLTNNLVFCLINLGEVDEAVRMFASIDAAALNADNRTTYLATAGLLAFRTGDPDQGRALYLRSIEGMRDPHARAIATIMLAREELLSRVPTADHTLEMVRGVEKEQSEADIALWLRYLPIVKLPA